MPLRAVPRTPESTPAKLYTPQVQVAVARTWGDAFSCLKTALGIPEPGTWLMARVHRLHVRGAKVEMALREMYDENFWQVSVIGGFLGCIGAFALAAWLVIAIMTLWPGK